MVAEDAHLQVLVLAGDLAGEQVDRPSAADEPRVGIALELGQRRGDDGEGAQASFSRTSWLTAEPWPARRSAA